MADVLLQITHVDDSVSGRGGPYLYFWGMTYNLRRLQLLIELFIDTIRIKLEMKGPPTSTSVMDTKQIYCVLINNQWHRAVPMQLKSNEAGSMDFFCIDSGGSYSVGLACVRTLDIFGYEAENLQKWPPLATRFMLADIVAPCLPGTYCHQWSDGAIIFLKAQLENRAWKAELIGMHGDYQGVRLFGSNNQALAAVMVQLNLGVMIPTPSQYMEIYSTMMCGNIEKDRAYIKPASDAHISCEKTPISSMFPSTNHPQQTFNDSPPPSANTPTINPSLKPVQRNMAITTSIFGIPLVDLAAEESLCVSFADKPGFFYGQLEKTSDIFVEIAAELKATYTSKPNASLFADAKTHLMEYGVVKLEEGEKYYRVLVIKELDGHVKVLFIDYGNKFLILRTKVLAPLDCLTHFYQPPCGIHCKLEGDVTVSESVWKNIITGKRIKVHIGKCVDGTYYVTFTNAPCNEEITKILLQNTTPTPTIPEMIESERDVSKAISLNQNFEPNCINKDTEQDPVEITVTPLTNDEVCSVKDILPKPIEPDKEIPMVKESATPPITAHLQHTYREQKILSDMVSKVEVIFVNDPSSFYVHLSDCRPTIEDLAEKLNFSYAVESKPAIRNAKPGLACVVQFEEDNLWYRGKIVNFCDTSMKSLVNVLFVDYGNIQCTSAKQLKILDEKFLELPPQAFHCSLNGIDISRAWTIEEKKKFETYCIGKTFSAAFASRDSKAKYSVQLKKEINGINLGINDNFATRNLTSVEQPTVAYTAIPVSNTSMDVSLTWYYNPNRFFISPIDLTMYQRVLEEFEKYYTSLTPNELIETNPSAGLPCVARFKEDGRYYRSQILSIRGQVAKIIFVDYGNEQYTPLSLLKRMDERFMKFPQMAWNCKLRGVKEAYPVNSEAQKYLEDCFVVGQPASVRFQSSDLDGNKEVLEVNLTVPKIGDVSEYLIEHKILERICLKNEAKIMPQTMDFPTGKIISTRALAVHVKSSTEFSLQLDPEVVGAIMDRIYLLTVNSEFIKKKTFIASVGKPCLALFPEDGLWYRAVVETINGNDIEVYYIDYGNKSIVNSSNLLELPADLASTPALAFKCCLHSSESSQKVNAEDFKSVVAGLSAILVRFLKMVDGILHVLLYSSDGVDLRTSFLNTELFVSSEPEEAVESATVTTAALELKGIISYYSSPNIFWFQLKKNQADMDGMETYLNELYPKNMKSHRVKTQPAVNEIYGAFHPIYFKWHRACINKCSDDTAEVYFLDYGDCQTVPISNIGYLPKRFRHVPPFAVRCYLKNVWKPFELTPHVLAVLDAVCFNPDTACRVVFERRGNDGKPFVASFFVGDQNIFELLATDVANEMCLKLASTSSR